MCGANQVLSFESDPDSELISEVKVWSPAIETFLREIYDGTLAARGSQLHRVLLDWSPCRLNPACFCPTNGPPRLPPLLNAVVLNSTFCHHDRPHRPLTISSSSTFTSTTTVVAPAGSVVKTSTTVRFDDNDLFMNLPLPSLPQRQWVTTTTSSSSSSCSSLAATTTTASAAAVNSYCCPHAAASGDPAGQNLEALDDELTIRPWMPVIARQIRHQTCWRATSIMGAFSRANAGSLFTDSILSLIPTIMRLACDEGFSPSRLPIPDSLHLGRMMDTKFLRSVVRSVACETRRAQPQSMISDALHDAAVRRAKEEQEQKLQREMEEKLYQERERVEMTSFCGGGGNKGDKVPQIQHHSFFLEDDVNTPPPRTTGLYPLHSWAAAEEAAVSLSGDYDLSKTMSPLFDPFELATFIAPSSPTASASPPLLLHKRTFSQMYY
jgi:hypothetical protein